MPIGVERLAFGDAPGGDVDDLAYDSARGWRKWLPSWSCDRRWQLHHLYETGVRYLIDGIERHRGYTPLIREPWLLFASLPLRPTASEPDTLPVRYLLR